jgi:succinyl-CoA synthetase beta subunit
LDGKINFDDNALFRQPEIVALRDMDEEDANEIEAKEKGLSFVQLDGDIGCMVNGAGLAMATMDMIQFYGGSPANFLDVGGSSNPEKVVHAFRLLTGNPKVKAILVNIFGGITRCDDIARGMLQAFEQIDITLPIVVRLSGTNAAEGMALLADTSLTTADSFGEAVQAVIAQAKGAA